MLVLSTNELIHLCTKHPIQNTARSVATVLYDGDRFTIRDAISAKYGYKQTEPVYSEFTVYVDEDTPVYFTHFKDTKEVGIDAPDCVQPMRHILMKRSNFAPEWTAN
jgi:hypothetical protein